MIDTNVHFLIDCNFIRPFWDQVLIFIKNTLETDFPISVKERYFGIFNPLDDNVICSINYMLLVARTFIWIKKRFKKQCHLIDFITYLKEQLMLENATQVFKLRPFVEELLQLL